MRAGEAAMLLSTIVSKTRNKLNQRVDCVELKDSYECHIEHENRDVESEKDVYTVTIKLPFYGPRLHPRETLFLLLIAKVSSGSAPYETEYQVIEVNSLSII